MFNQDRVLGVGGGRVGSTDQIESNHDLIEAANNLGSNEELNEVC